MIESRQPPRRIAQRRRIVAILVPLLALAATATASDRHLEVVVHGDLISVEARGVSLAELLQTLARECDLDLHLGAPAAQSVDLKSADLSLTEAVERILASGEYAYGLSIPVAAGGRRRGALFVFPPRPIAPAHPEAGRPLEGHAPHRRLAKLIESLADPDPKRRVDTVSRLTEIGAEAAEALADLALFDEARSVREEALIGLGETGDAAYLPTLEAALRDPEVRVRQSAVWALAEVGGEEAAWALATALGDEDPSLRAEAAYGLGEIGGEGAIHLLEQALADENGSVREAAGEMLAELTDRE